MKPEHLVHDAWAVASRKKLDETTQCIKWFRWLYLIKISCLWRTGAVCHPFALGSSASVLFPGLSSRHMLLYPATGAKSLQYKHDVNFPRFPCDVPDDKYASSPQDTKFSIVPTWLLPSSQLETSEQPTSGYKWHLHQVAIADTSVHALSTPTFPLGRLTSRQ
jgi:hypothetical protein